MTIYPQLSPHFGGKEVAVNSHGYDCGPLPVKVKAALVALAVDVLEPWRAIVGPIKINRMWANEELNKLQGGVPGSQHILGEAADCTPICVANGSDLLDCFNGLINSDIDFDQAIIYPNRLFIHVSRKFTAGDTPARPQRGEVLINSGTKEKPSKVYKSYRGV